MQNIPLKLIKSSWKDHVVRFSHVSGWAGSNHYLFVFVDEKTSDVYSEFVYNKCFRTQTVEEQSWFGKACNRDKAREFMNLPAEQISSAHFSQLFLPHMISI